MFISNISKHFPCLLQMHTKDSISGNCVYVQEPEVQDKVYYTLVNFKLELYRKVTTTFCIYPFCSVFAFGHNVEYKFIIECSYICKSSFIFTFLMELFLIISIFTYLSPLVNYNSHTLFHTLCYLRFFLLFCVLH